MLSGVFWLLMTLNETYEKEIAVPIKLVNVPQKAFITNDMIDTVRFVVRDKGYVISSYLTSGPLRPLTFNFATYSNDKGYGVIPQSDIQKQLLQQLSKSTTLVSIKTDKIEFYYNYGESKRVPVKSQGEILTGGNCYLSKVVCQPDSVTVYASQKMLDSIQCVYIVRQRFADITQPTTVDVKLQQMKGVKIVPNHISMKLYPDVLTEESVEEPNEAEKILGEKVLRTFPQKVTVHFAVGATRLYSMPKNPQTKVLLPQGFRVVVNYQDLVDHPSDKCDIRLTAVPTGVHNARLEVDKVDYLLEQK